MSPICSKKKCAKITIEQFSKRYKLQFRVEDQNILNYLMPLKIKFIFSCLMHSTTACSSHWFLILRGILKIVKSGVHTLGNVCFHFFCMSIRMNKKNVMNSKVSMICGKSHSLIILSLNVNSKTIKFTLSIRKACIVLNHLMMNPFIINNITTKEKLTIILEMNLEMKKKKT